MKPINLDIYNLETGEVEKTISQPFIPWKLTKELLKAQKDIQENPSAEDSLEIMENIVIKAFTGKINEEDLEKCDIGDIPRVFRELGERLQGH